MPSINSLSKSIERQTYSNKKQREAFVAKKNVEKELAISKWYQEGGDVFLEWVKEHYRMYTGDSLRWDEPFLEEFYLLLGTPWVERLIISKPSQVGYTEALIAFTAFFLAYLRLPIGFGFEEDKKLNDIVGSRIQLAFDHCEPIKLLSSSLRTFTGRSDIDQKRSITVSGVKASFFYARTKSKSSEEQAARQAASSYSSWSACGIVADEIELWPAKVLSIVKRRMDRSPLLTKLFRCGSTPGAEGGIVDGEVRNSKYRFEWHFNCSECGKAQVLDPFGNFLRCTSITDNGIEKKVFADPIGRPISWFHSDRDNPIESAFIGCKHCEQAVDRDSISAGEFICVNNHIALRDFCHQLTIDKQVEHESVALLLPRLASLLFNPIEWIREQITSTSPSDGFQQGLGKPFSLGGGKIEPSHLQKCVGISLPDEFKVKPDLIIVGLDQGRHSSYAVKQEWHFADFPDKDAKWKYAFKKITWWGEVNGFEWLEDFVKEHNVDLICADNEPEYNMATAYALKHPPHAYNSKSAPKGQVFLGDQGELKGLGFRRTIRKIKDMGDGKERYRGRELTQEKDVVVYLIDRTFGLDSVRDRIFRSLQSFPADTSYNSGDKGNFLYHYTTSDRIHRQSSRNVDDIQWVKPSGLPDHYFHADSFGEVLCLASLYEPGIRREMAFDAINFI